MSATNQKQDITHSLLKSTNQRLDQFESILASIASSLNVKGVAGVGAKGGAAGSPFKAGKGGFGKGYDGEGAMTPNGSPSLSPKSNFAKKVKNAGDGLNETVRANLVRVYGRNRNLLMEAETIILWAALHWSHYHLSFSFCTWRGGTHGGMLREILATRAALHWRMQEVARAFNTWNYTAITMMIQKEVREKHDCRLKNESKSLLEPCLNIYILE